MGLLSTSDVLSGAGHSDDWNVVVVAAEELLGARHNVANDQSSAERENDVLVVRMEDHATVDLACNHTERKWQD